MLKKDLSDILTYPVIAGKGIGDIEVGMQAKDFIDQYISFESYYYDKIVEQKTFFPKLCTFTFYKSIDVSIDITTSEVVSIDAYNLFSGRYLDRIGIGSHVWELKGLRDDVYFDEEYILLGEDWELFFEVNDDVNRAINERYLYELVIEKIQIRKPVLNHDTFPDENRRVHNTIWKLYEE